MGRVREKHDTKIYYSISEASAIAKVKPHVLRYWETQFKMLRPKKNKAGNRMYRKRDLKLIQLIKELLYEKGFTIAGARRKLLDERAQLKEQLELSFTDVDRSTMLMEIIRDLKSLLKDVRGTAPAGSGGVVSLVGGDGDLDDEMTAEIESDGNGDEGALLAEEEFAGEAGAESDEEE